MNLKSLFFASVAGLLVMACSKDDEPAPTTGTVKGVVTAAASGEFLADATIIIFNADNNAPTGTTLYSDANGNFSAELEPGNYFIKLYKQGFTAVPVSGIEAVPFSISTGAETDQSFALLATNVLQGGFISGKVTEGSAAKPGTLVVAENFEAGIAFSSVSDGNGDYAIFNVPAGSYKVRAYGAGLSSTYPSVSVTANSESANVDVQVTANASGTLSGTVRNLSAENKDVDVSLVHPLTKETIPGLSTASVAQSYQIKNIPDGTFIARATYKNDVRVMDPDRIAKFGEPVVEYSGGNSIDLTFDITKSISLSASTNAAESVVPVDLSSTPTFEWVAYSSTSDYVIEVIDASTGVIVWGGFDKSGDLPVKNITVPSSQKSIAYNADGNATSELLPGHIYRWKVYASKDDQNSPTGWTLISASEDQVGLFRVVP